MPAGARCRQLSEVPPPLPPPPHRKAHSHNDRKTIIWPPSSWAYVRGSVARRPARSRARTHAARSHRFSCDGASAAARLLLVYCCCCCCCWRVHSATPHMHCTATRLVACSAPARAQGQPRWRATSLPSLGPPAEAAAAAAGAGPSRAVEPLLVAAALPQPPTAAALS